MSKELSPKKKVYLVRMIVEYPVMYSEDFDISNVDFHRNESSWCCDNALEELQDFTNDNDKSGCLCNRTKFEVIKEVKE